MNSKISFQTCSSVGPGELSLEKGHRGNILALAGCEAKLEGAMSVFI